MNITCDNCKQNNKGRYSSFFLDKELVTLCDDCRWGMSLPTSENKDKKTWEHISTPFWVHAGLKPNASDKAKLAYMKQHNLTWGDLRKERDAKYAKSEAGLKAFYEHKRQFGTSNAPEKDFGKNG